MARNIEVGIIGEKEARKFLSKKGYKIIEQNFRCKLGEIDIIAKQEDTIVFVEVKTRKNNLFGTPAQAVNKSKQMKIIKTALYYLKIHNEFSKNIRFDVIEVWFSNGIVQDVNIIPNAFLMT
ncbi:YraN family protein [Irregularibacter muris]|uniref:UPF0102 protein NSA47_03880 n=1 Tax=Irregularibacter muris TaxID=1796619 RepID=A0AAE3KZ52_9FIRM|nr:YraN family protein [Irregularibacter muris]MCR1898126.1 YraN family protein [Irregularibacter muris]